MKQKRKDNKNIPRARNATRFEPLPFFLTTYPCRLMVVVAVVVVGVVVIVVVVVVIVVVVVVAVGC